MGYDIVFWKQVQYVPLSPKIISKSLAEGTHVDGVDALPIADIFTDLKAIYPGIYKEDNSENWAWNSTYPSYPNDFPEIVREYGDLPKSMWPEDTGGFNCYVSPYRLFFNCHLNDLETLNPMIEALAKYGCRLYDPQDDIRFDKV